MRLFDLPTVRTHLGVSLDPEEDTQIRAGSPPPRTDFLEAAFDYARATYPDRPTLHQACFAALVELFATGWYGGYGTESEPLERKVEALILAFAGGTPPAEDSVIAFTPPLDAQGEPILPLPGPEWTEKALDLMEVAFFGPGYATALRLARSEAVRVPGALETWYATRQALGLPQLREEEGWTERMPITSNSLTAPLPRSSIVGAGRTANRVA